MHMEKFVYRSCCCLCIYMKKNLSDRSYHDHTTTTTTAKHLPTNEKVPALYSPAIESPGALRSTSPMTIAHQDLEFNSDFHNDDDQLPLPPAPIPSQQQQQQQPGNEQGSKAGQSSSSSSTIRSTLGINAKTSTIFIFFALLSNALFTFVIGYSHRCQSICASNGLPIIYSIFLLFYPVQLHLSLSIR
jgi:hypothetical protein